MRRVAIVGLPNSGKSTLFNRLTGRRKALVHRRAGMTRDRLYGTVRSEGGDFEVIDTGGVAEAADPLQRAISRQVELAVGEADLVLILVDRPAGLRPEDRTLVESIRRRKPFLLVVNKVDVETHESLLADFAQLGADLVPISAEHGRGIDDLLDAIRSRLAPAEPAPEGDAQEITLTIVGRPNSGKSTLLNRLVGFERASVSEVPGTTRDTIDARIVAGGHRFRILDTAGIRRKARIDDSQEIFAVLAARRTIEQADCTLLLVDGASGVGAQDRYLAAEVAATAKSAIVLVNKLDLAPSFHQGRASRQMTDALSELRWARRLFVSALTGRGTLEILSTAAAAVDEGNTKVPTAELNRYLARLLEERSPMFEDGVSAPLKYAVQVGCLPIRIQFFTTRRTRFLPAYEKNLANRIRREFDLTHSPIRLLLKSGREPRFSRTARMVGR